MSNRPITAFLPYVPYNKKIYNIVTIKAARWLVENRDLSEYHLASAESSQEVRCNKRIQHLYEFPIGYQWTCDCSRTTLDISTFMRMFFLRPWSTYVTFISSWAQLIALFILRCEKPNCCYPALTACRVLHNVYQYKHVRPSISQFGRIWYICADRDAMIHFVCKAYCGTNL